MLEIDFGSGPGTGDTVRAALGKLQARLNALSVKPARPAPPPCPAAVTSVTDLETPGIPSNGTDAAPAINAALNANGTVILDGTKTYSVASAVMRPSYSKLLGRDGTPARLACLPNFSGGQNNSFNALVCNAAGASDLLVYNINADVQGVGAQSNDTRINPFKNWGAHRVRMQQTLSSRGSGYGNFDQYAQVNGDCYDILWDRCGSIDCSYAFEQMGAKTYVLDGWAEAGAATQQLNGMLHPTAGSSLTVVRFKGRGAFGRGIYILCDEGRVMEEHYFEDVDVFNTGGAFALYIEGNGIVRKMTFIGGRIRGLQGAGLSSVTGRSYGTIFEAAAQAGNSEVMTLQTGAHFDMDTTTKLVGSTPSAGSNVFGLQMYGDSTTRFDGEVICSPGANGQAFPVSGTALVGLEIGPNARFLASPVVVLNDNLDAEPAHMNGTLRFTSSTAQNYRVLADTANTTMPVSTTIHLERLGAGTVTIMAGAGVILTAPGGAVIDSALGKGTLTKSGPNAWTFANLASGSGASAGGGSGGASGAELIVNGTFASGTSGWVDENPGGQDISWDPSGKLKMTVGAGYGAAYQHFEDGIAGATYAFKANMSTPDTKMRIRILNNGTPIATYDQLSNPTGVVDTTFVLPAAGRISIFMAAGDAGSFANTGEVALFANISLKKLP